MMIQGPESFGKTGTDRQVDDTVRGGLTSLAFVGATLKNTPFVTAMGLVDQATALNSQNEQEVSLEIPEGEL